MQEEASVWLAAGSKVAVTAHLLQAMASVTQIPFVSTESDSHDYFTGVDNVLEINIVTADGNHIIANAYRNKDLFWALRGGGGGTWGIVTSVTYQTHPSTPFSGALIAVNSTNATSTQRYFMEIIHLIPSLVEQSYRGYGCGFVGGFMFFVLSPNVTAEQTNATFRPLFEFAHSLPGLSVLNETVLFPDWWQFYDPAYSRDAQVGVATELSSWLLPKDVVSTNKPEDLAKELLKISGIGFHLVTGRQVSRDPQSFFLIYEGITSDEWQSSSARPERNHFFVHTP